jgi:hypothetical protein
MSGIMDMITEQLGSSMMQEMTKKIGGGNSDGMNRAMAVAVPMILSQLKKNTSSRKGAESLNNALEKDHDGGILDSLGSLLGGAQQSSNGGLMGSIGDLLGGSKSRQTDGGKILGHIFGNKQGNIAEKLGQATGIGGKDAGGLMEMLAPIVMGAVGKAKRQNNAGVSGLQDLLRQEQKTIKQRQPQLGGLESLLDDDGDGDVDMSDILKKGSGLLGGFFKR